MKDNYLAEQKSVALPMRPFLYTVDQLAAVLDVSEDDLMHKYLYFEGHSVGRKPPVLMLARRLGEPTSQHPDWRVAELELIRWLKFKRWKLLYRGWITSG